MAKCINRWLCVLLVVLCAPVEAQLRLLTEDAPPMSFLREGEPSGFSVEVVRALLARTGDSVDGLARPDLLRLPSAERPPPSIMAA